MRRKKLFDCRDLNELEYWVASHIVTVRVANREGQILTLHPGAVSFQIKLFHSPPMPRPKSKSHISFVPYFYNVGRNPVS